MKRSVSILVMVAAASAAAQGQAPAARTAPVSVRAPIRSSTTAVQAPVAAATAKQVLPANLMGIEDRAIIIVGGRPVAAGDVKRDLVSEMRRGATPGPVVRGPSRLAGIPTMPVRDQDGPKPIPGGFARPKLVADSASRHASVRDALGKRDATALAQRPHSIAEARDYCRTHPPEISRIRGTVTPNGRFKVEGLCFGERTGRLEAIGQFPGGNMRLVFESWTDGEIGAFVPPVTGAADHPIAVTVVRTDNARSPAAQARFVATRTTVPVPPRYWTPDADYFQLDVDQGGGNIFSGFKVWGAGAASRSTPFVLAVNPACALDQASWSSSAGRIEAFNGWENGPPHQANVEVIWTPRCVTQTTNYVFASSSQRVCTVGFVLSATASCPVGVSP